MTVVQLISQLVFTEDDQAILDTVIHCQYVGLIFNFLTQMMMMIVLRLVYHMACPPKKARPCFS